MRKNIYRMQFILLALFALSGCGGGGGGGSDPGGGGGSSAGPGGSGGGNTVSAMTMDCAEGAGYQCSGSDILRRENGITLTRSGVQVYGRSSQDDLAGAQSTTGLAIGTNPSAIADVRVRKSGSTVSWVGLVLDNIGITWDGQRERPTIIETFDRTYGRNELTAANRINGAVALPLPSDLAFYDWASREQSATQSHYANNRYFPRDTDRYPLRCLTDDPDCTNSETSGISNSTADGLGHASAGRKHNDGDIHAGDGPGGAILPGGDGQSGVPFPGSKGDRSFQNWGYSYANLTYWMSHDTVEISEWLLSPTCGARACVEHNQNRHGMVAFGDTTAPTSVPNSGSATYSGFVYGRHAASGSSDEEAFQASATVSVNFASRSVTVTVSDAPGGSLTLTTSLRSGDEANYLTGTVSNAAGSGGLSARLFGPTAQEIAGVFSLTGAGGSATIGGFVARR